MKGDASASYTGEIVNRYDINHIRGGLDAGIPHFATFQNLGALLWT